MSYRPKVSPVPNNSNLVDLFAIECSFCSVVSDAGGEAHNVQNRVCCI